MFWHFCNVTLYGFETSTLIVPLRCSAKNNNAKYRKLFISKIRTQFKRCYIGYLVTSRLHCWHALFF
jgi:hypothetical protein